jgi:hypothetical protein
MPHHVQARLDDATFKEVKIDAINKDKSIGDYVKDAVVEQLERSKSESVVEETVNQPKLNSIEGE